MKAKIGSLLLTVVLLATMIPTAAFAFSTGNYVEIKEQHVAGDVYKLVVSASTDTGVSSMDMILSFDKTVVVPVRAADTGKIVEIEDEDTRQTPLVCIGEDEEGGAFVLSPTLWKVHGDRAAVRQAVYITDKKYLAKEAGKRPMMELYYKLRDGKTTADLNGKTFQIETGWGTSAEDSFLYDFFNGVNTKNTAPLTVVDTSDPIKYYYYGQADGTEAGLELSLTYTGSDQVEPALQTPPAPTNVKAEGTGATTAKLSWTAPKLGDGVPAVTEYKITGTNGFSETTAGAGATELNLTGLTKGTSYTFTILATNSNGDGKTATAAGSIWSEPGKPTLTLTAASETSVTASWTAPTDTGGTPITAYTLTVTAANSVGPGAASDEKTVTLEAGAAEAPTVKAEETALLVESGQTAKLAVTASVTDGGTLSYQWYQAPTAAAEKGTELEGATSAGYTTPALTETSYYYCVVTNTKGKATSQTTSELITVTVESGGGEPDPEPPTKPSITNLTLSPNNGSLSASWTATGEPDYYTLVLTHVEEAKEETTEVYKYKDGTEEKTVPVEGTESKSSGSAIYITVEGISYPATTGTAIVTIPKQTVTDVDTTTAAVSYNFKQLKNGTLYTLTLTATKGKQISDEKTATAIPKENTGTGSGGGGGGSSSSSTISGTEIKKEFSSSGNVTVGAGDLKNAKSVEAKSGQITVMLNQQAINALDKTSAVLLKAEKTSGVTLNDTARTLLGSRPVFDVTATQNGKTVTDFGSGRITISIAYAPVSSEDTGKLFLYYVNDNGEAEKVSGSRYDATLKAVTGQTGHLSVYAVGYDENAGSGAITPGAGGLFRDISSSDWFYTAVLDLAGKEILSGVPDEDANGNPIGSYTFRPQANVTRAEFVTMLAKAAGVNLSSYSSKVFNDVNISDWYAGAVAWANSTGVASGTGDGNFNPNANITRQDMAVMVNKYISNVAKTTLTAKNAKLSFTDAAQIESYAAAAVETMQTAGIISGIPHEDVNGNPIGTYQFRPFANATRAEAAAMLHGLLTAVQ